MPTTSLTGLMASPLHLLLSMLLLVLVLPDVHATFHHISRAVIGHQHAKTHRPKFKPGPWGSAHATFYGGSDASGTNGGACGYGNLGSKGYGHQIVAISPDLFNNGLSCGACYEVKCSGEKQLCKLGQPSLFVTATDLCPSSPNDNGGSHFDLSQPAFLQVAEFQAGIVPIQYRRVSCHKVGGIRFTITGNPHYNTVLVWNVGGAGDVQSVKVKGNKLNWTTLTRDWGQTWRTSASLVGESLTFRVTAEDGRTSTSWHIAPRNWQFGQTYEGKNFK